MSKPPADDKGGEAQPRRRTPTYMDAVRVPTPGGSPVPEGSEREAAPNPRSGVGSRTRIGLPPVTILPGQVRRGAQPGGAGGNNSGSTALAPTEQSPRVLSRETVMLGSAPKPEAQGHNNPQSLVVSTVRFEGGALDRAAPTQPRGRKTRPTVPAAEVQVTKHTVPGDRNWPLVVLGQRFPPQSSSIRSLRHRLAEKGDPRVVLVTSAGRRDGKTFCAANLALALAEIRRSRVLLIETNVYHPSLAALFGVSKHTCFLDQLELHRRDFVAPWKVTELSSHSLHLLAINSRTEKVRGLEGALFTNCLDSLRGTYDYIIIDGPPVSAGPDVSLQEDAVDGILFVARTDHARASSLKYALDQVSPQDVLGVVLLDI
jgi:Mrp family chromosome partitioning ATPase